MMSSIIHFLAVSPDLKYSDTLKFYESMVSPERAARMKRYRFENDRIVSLLAGLLCRKAILQDTGLPSARIRYGYGPNGKPFLPELPDYHFSLSHTKSTIVFLSDSAPVGIDIEIPKERKSKKLLMEIADHYFTPVENQYLKSHPPEETAFAKLWTRKEAYVKMTGDGLLTSLRSFDVMQDQPDVFYRTASHHENTVSACFRKKPGNLSFRDWTIRELLADD